MYTVAHFICNLIKWAAICIEKSMLSIYIKIEKAGLLNEKNKRICKYCRSDFNIVINVALGTWFESICFYAINIRHNFICCRDYACYIQFIKNYP